MEATVNLTGYAGGDVTLTQTRAGDARAKFRLAVTPRALRDGQWTDLETIWFTVECYRALAENVTASVHRGDPVAVAGRLRTRVWTDDDHVEHARTVVEAHTVGHDLTRGTSDYHRSNRPRGTDDPFGDAEPPDDAAREQPSQDRPDARPASDSDPQTPPHEEAGRPLVAAG